MGRPKDKRFKYLTDRYLGKHEKLNGGDGVRAKKYPFNLFEYYLASYDGTFLVPGLIVNDKNIEMLNRYYTNLKTTLEKEGSCMDLFAHKVDIDKGEILDLEETDIKVGDVLIINAIDVMFFILNYGVFTSIDFISRCPGSDLLNKNLLARLENEKDSYLTIKYNRDDGKELHRLLKTFLDREYSYVKRIKLVKTKNNKFKTFRKNPLKFKDSRQLTGGYLSQAAYSQIKKPLADFFNTMWDLFMSDLTLHVSKSPEEKDILLNHTDYVIELHTPRKFMYGSRSDRYEVFKTIR